MDKIILYTTGCPKCFVLKKKLEAANISYEACTDVDIMRSLGINAVPVLVVNEKMLNFIEANEWIGTIKESK